MIWTTVVLLPAGLPTLIAQLVLIEDATLALVEHVCYPDIAYSK